MKTRIIVAVIAVPILFLIVLFAPLWAYSIVVGLISAGAAFEFLRCVEKNIPLRFQIYAMIVGFSTPFFSSFNIGNIVTNTAVFVITIVMFVELMLSFSNEEHLKAETVIKVIFAGGVMPLLLASMVRVGFRSHSSVYLLFPYVAAFSSDTGAYFAGKFLGKNKAFPHLSPNKTWEGCLGGLVSDMLMMLLYGLILMLLKYDVNFYILLLYGFFGSIACQLGDLAFSAVKRQYDIKDYGTLIPGHGGMLDRFDSMHFTAPMIEILVLLLPAIK